MWKRLEANALRERVSRLSYVQSPADRRPVVDRELAPIRCAACACSNSVGKVNISARAGRVQSPIRNCDKTGIPPL